jgi:hypothetical protein
VPNPDAERIGRIVGQPLGPAKEGTSPSENVAINIEEVIVESGGSVGAASQDLDACAVPILPPRSGGERCCWAVATRSGWGAVTRRWGG